MAKLSRKAGATSQILQVFIQNSTSTTGAGLTGLAYNTAGLTAYYHRDTDTTATAVSLVTMTSGTFTSGGFVEIDATNMPGWYQFCPPNAALASGAANVGFHLKGATNMAPLPLEIDLDAQVDVALWNGTAVLAPATAGIPDVNVKNINNAAAATPGASGGLLISGSNAGTTTFGALTISASFTIADGLLISRSTSNASAITATGNGTGSGVVATSGSGASGDGIKAVAASSNGNGVTMTHAGSGSDLNATTTPLTLAKTTNITGFNDIAASSVVSGGAITTSGGAVSTVSAVTGLTASNLDAAVSSRMATYSQPTGFLAATFPSGTIANTTNITGGTITTATNLTNAPGSGDFTAAMKASLNAATPASVTGSVGSVTASVKLDGTSALTEAYAAPGAPLTLATALYAITQMVGEMSIIGTTMTVRKRDQSATAQTFTLDSAASPTAITQAS